MKAFLMYRDRDVDPGAPLPWNADALIQDLELDTLFDAMGGGDAFVRAVVVRSVLDSLHDLDDIAYRQAIVADCLRRPDVIREIHAIAVEAIEREKRVYGGILGRQPERLLARSLDVLQIFLELLTRLRRLSDEHASVFRSEGLGRFFHMIATELDDAYLASIADHLDRLRFDRGMLISAGLGEGNKGADYVLRVPPAGKRRLVDLVLGDRSGLVYTVADRDVAGFEALAELRNRGLSVVARALAQSAEHILGFFAMLRVETAFYVGCVNLHDQLAARGEPACMPQALPARDPRLSAKGLYDACLSLRADGRVVGNDVAAAGKELIMVTGANRGGKSTFLRSVGVAQLMMQAGMFVAAESFGTDVASGIFTHYRREEDATMTRGKFDEELARMSAIVERIGPGGILLLNESFASTNELEGSEIARHVIEALLDAGIKVVCVTHLFELADGFHRDAGAGTLFLRAERRADGQRTFRVVEGEPLPTSHGADLYRRIFGAAPGSPEATAAGGPPA